MLKFCAQFSIPKSNIQLTNKFVLLTELLMVKSLQVRFVKHSVLNSTRDILKIDLKKSIVLTLINLDKFLGIFVNRRPGYHVL